jgi:hypothetical protein
MNCATFIEKLTEVQGTVEQLLAQLEVSEHDKFAATFASRAAKFDAPASDRTRATKPLSAQSSQPTKSRRA